MARPWRALWLLQGARVRRRKGDIDLDLSLVQLARLKVRAAGEIVAEDATTPVPEPATGLLVGAGLALLGVRPRHHLSA